MAIASQIPQKVFTLRGDEGWSDRNAVMDDVVMNGRMNGMELKPCRGITVPRPSGFK